MTWLSSSNIDVALAAVLDERILLGHRPEVHALAEVVHRLEVLAPARVDDLEDHEPLDLAHQLGAEAGLAVVVGVERVLAELLRSSDSRERSTSSRSSSTVMSLP